MIKRQFEINKQILTIEIADTFLSRLCGLMFRSPLKPQQGLLLAPCNSVHMLFMRFAIDVVYLDKDYRIKKIVHNLSTWIGLSMCLGAWAAVELRAGEATRLKLQVGQILLPKNED